MGMFGGYLGSPGVTPGSVAGSDLASGAVQSGHMGNASVLSGSIGSGQISSEHLADGTVIQVDIGSGAVGSGALSSGTVSRFHMASGAINSGHMASGAVQGFFGATRHIASGTVGVSDFGSGAVNSGHFASGLAAMGVDGVGVYALRDGTNAQIFHLYGTYSNDSNYERLGVGYSGGAYVLGSENAGTGQGRVLIFKVGNTNYWQLESDGDFVALTDNSYDIGTNGANRPRSVHAGTSVESPRMAFRANTEQAVSGLIVVSWGSGGCFVVPAERASGLRSQAIGVVLGNHVSGDAVTVIHKGLVSTSVSGMIASGFHGRYLYLGSGGLIINQSGFAGGASSGEGAAPTAAGSGYSGALVLRVGVSISGGIYVDIGELSSGLYSGLLGQW